MLRLVFRRGLWCDGGPELPDRIDAGIDVVHMSLDSETSDSMVRVVVP